MNLSIWHCLLLYCCGNATIERIAEKAEISVSLLNQAKSIDKWDFKKSQFLKLSPKQKTSMDILELLFGEFQNDESKVAFVQQIIDALKSKKVSKVDKSAIKLQKVSQLAEFGMTHEQATAFVEEVQKISGAKEVPDKLAGILPGELSIQDKLDTVNNGYRHLVSGYNSQLANCYKILENAIEFYADEINSLKAARSKSNDFDEIAGRQRTLSYNAQSLFRLIQLYYEMTGAKSHVNHEAVAAKMFGEGYFFMKQNEFNKYLPGQ